jgi:ribosomal protein L15E
MAGDRTPPWKKRRPKTGGATKLTPASLVWAKARATAAGRRYPNLVDNMAALRRQIEAEHGGRGADHP